MVQLSSNILTLASAPRHSLTLHLPQHLQPRHSHRSAPGLSSDDDSDSEIENFTSPCKKKPSLLWPTSHSNQFQNPNHLKGSLQEPSARKGKDIWSSMLTEDNLTFGVKEMVADKIIDNSRDVESYDYTRAELDPRKRNEVEEELVEEEEEGQEEVDLETFGMEAKPKIDMKSRLGRISKESLSSGSDGDEKRSHGEGRGRKGNRKEKGSHRKRTHSTRKMQTKELSGRLGARSYDASKDRSHIKVSADDSCDKVAAEIMQLLGEPEEQRTLFTDLVQAVGCQRALEILYMTEDLEEAGGIMTLVTLASDCEFKCDRCCLFKNGYRRRTPGGIFLMLIKDTTVENKEKVDAVFLAQRRQHWQKIKAERKKCKKQDRLKNEVENGDEMQVQETLLPVLADKKDVIQPNVFLAENSEEMVEAFGV
ncbi:hypothetical protein CAPTEDRAFT_206723 [Capitella teleta]|uniref:Phosphorylated adapter RNA export protein n=1 Tax=Capitella teleta TaxID=283909 RepID=R7TUU8_CAPTE|nr:hypothetical protein CAPTEDRAFT_206723 [Capitella teleta]|eukprot:ELT97688.1 hypothetical protein CAPTEDRAFT_206723 [Capitella teleta]